MRISDWSSDVCSSDLFDRQKVSAGTRKKIRLRKIVPSDTATSSRAVAKRSDCNASAPRSEEHTSELQSLMRISYAVFCLKKKTKSETQDVNNDYDKANQQTSTTHKLKTHIDNPH